VWREFSARLHRVATTDLMIFQPNTLPIRRWQENRMLSSNTTRARCVLRRTSSSANSHGRWRGHRLRLRGTLDPTVSWWLFVGNWHGGDFPYCAVGSLGACFGLADLLRVSVGVRPLPTRSGYKPGAMTRKSFTIGVIVLCDRLKSRVF